MTEIIISMYDCCYCWTVWINGEICVTPLAEDLLHIILSNKNIFSKFDAICQNDLRIIVCEDGGIEEFIKHNGKWKSSDGVIKKEET